MPGRTSARPSATRGGGGPARRDSGVAVSFCGLPPIASLWGCGPARRPNPGFPWRCREAGATPARGPRGLAGRLGSSRAGPCGLPPGRSPDPRSSGPTRGSTAPSGPGRGGVPSGGRGACPRSPVEKEHGCLRLGWVVSPEGGERFCRGRCSQPSGALLLALFVCCFILFFFKFLLLVQNIYVFLFLFYYYFIMGMSSLESNWRSIGKTKHKQMCGLE